MTFPEAAFPEEITMDALVTKMNALCEALPFQTGWYLKDLKTGKSANRLGDVPCRRPARARSPS